MKTSHKLIITTFGLLMIFLILYGTITPQLGLGERTGVVIYTRTASYPCKLTFVWMRFYTPDGIINDAPFAKAYYGWHDFELGQIYRISYNRNWNQIYKRIIELEIVQSSEERRTKT